MYFRGTQAYSHCSLQFCTLYSYSIPQYSVKPESGALSAEIVAGILFVAMTLSIDEYSGLKGQRLRLKLNTTRGTSEGLECTALYRPAALPETRGETRLVGSAVNKTPRTDVRARGGTEYRDSTECRDSNLQARTSTQPEYRARSTKQAAFDYGRRPDSTTVLAFVSDRPLARDTTVIHTCGPTHEDRRRGWRRHRF